MNVRVEIFSTDSYSHVCFKLSFIYRGMAIMFFFQFFFRLQVLFQNQHQKLDYDVILSLQKSNPCHFYKKRTKNEVFKKCCYYVLSQCNVVNSFLMGQSHFLMQMQVHENRNAPSIKISLHCNVCILIIVTLQQNLRYMVHLLYNTDLQLHDFLNLEHCIT